MATLTIKKQEEIKWDEVKAAVQRGELPEEAEIGFTLKSGESVSLTVTAPKDGKAYLVFSDLTAILPMYDEWPDRPVSWKESSLRRWANEDFIKKLPDELVNIIIPRDIVQTVKGERMETRDLLWAPSYRGKAARQGDHAGAVPGDHRRGVRGGMNNTEVIAKLCHVIDLQNVIIQAQAMELNQLGAVTKAEEIAAARTIYAETMGEEAPT